MEERHIQRRKDGWYVLSRDKTRVLGGPYKSQKAALKRLRQIEWFKENK